MPPPLPLSGRMRVLVVGADGEIGRALAAHLSAVGAAAVGTTRRTGVARAGRLFLDLAADPGDWPALPAADAAVICAAVARVADCERDPDGARRVNVDGPLALVRRLPPGCHTLFLSTNHVLDGSAPRQRADAPYCPASAYGAQKAMAERELLALGSRGGGLAVLRLAKVLTPSDPLFLDWAAALAVGRPAAPFADIVNAPAPLSFVCGLIERLLAARASGLFQASGDCDLAYAEMALLLAEALGRDPGLVRPVDARRPGSRFLDYPRYASLDMSRVAETLGIAPPSSVATVRDVCRAVAAAVRSRG
ncbi:MAG TPA: sugar nucleotide-binding protein [Stellaceae bacterium]